MSKVGELVETSDSEYVGTRDGFKEICERLALSLPLK